MKFLYLFASANLLLFLSCQNPDEMEFINEMPEKITRSANNILSLENTQKAILTNGDTISLPWAATTASTILNEVRLDVAESDGWNILYTTLQILNYSTTVSAADNGLNYILLYNRYRGLLKGFYYAIDPIPNNTAFWLLSSPEQTNMFNFVPYFALPKNSTESPQQISLTNISTDGITQGFQKGWNCFMTELSYDEGSRNNHLDISGYAMNQSTFTFNGQFNSTSSGTIISTASTESNNIKAIANLVGQAGKNWILSNTKESTNSNKVIKFSRDAIASLLGNGIKGLITTGLSKIFGSSNGVTNSISTLQFSTNGSVTIQGKSYTPMTGYIWPIAGIPLNGLGEDLGAWCLETTPSFIADSYIKLKEVQRTPTYFRNIYTLKFAPSYNVTKNPALGYFSCSIVPVLYERTKWGPTGNWNGFYGNVDTPVFRVVNPTILYEDSVTKICDTPLSYDVLATDLMPTKTSSDNIPVANIADSRYYIRENIALQFTSSFLNNGNFIYSIKTFIPEQTFTNNISGMRPYNWTYTELETKGYVK